MTTILRTAAMLTIAVLASCPGMLQADDKDKPAADKPATDKSDKTKTDKAGWKPLFNGKDLAGWKVTNFGGEGEVYVENKEVIITQGVDLSGISSTSKTLPKSNYEIEFEAQRAEGSDFFVGLTFPVKDDPCSLILGGWGGGVCGLSSLDGMDASENDTTCYLAFARGKWYKIRLRVTDDRIQAWLDKDQIVDVETKYHKISIRYEMDLSTPLGFATYQTTSHIRNARIRQLPKDAGDKDKLADKDTNEAATPKAE